MKYCLVLVFIITSFVFSECSKEPPTEIYAFEWERETTNPIFRDSIPAENYEAASDQHVFFDDKGELHMIYSGNINGILSIKMANGDSYTDWGEGICLLSQPGPSGKDIAKETSFYFKAPNGKHQIYYIGYKEDNDYESEVYLAEADSLEGPFIQSENPVIPRGIIAGKDVYCITSPSVNEHAGKLYMSFIGWNDSPSNVTAVWVLGAISRDNGKTWGEFQETEARIAMEGQITKRPDGRYYAVRTGEFKDTEAIFIAQADHPFGPYVELENPILVKSKSELEKNEATAPQLLFNPESDERILFYTGADHNKGWWIMMAREK